jgi:hypothetical protein
MRCGHVSISLGIDELFQLRCGHLLGRDGSNDLRRLFKLCCWHIGFFCRVFKLHSVYRGYLPGEPRINKLHQLLRGHLVFDRWCYLGFHVHFLHCRYLLRECRPIRIIGLQRVCCWHLLCSGCDSMHQLC